MMLVDTKAILEKMSEAVFAHDTETLKSLVTKDCMCVGPDGKEVPFVQNWNELTGSFERIRWINTYSLVTPTKLIGRCYDYAETKDGKVTIFSADFIPTFNEQVLISRHEWFLNPDQAKLFAKVMPESES